MSVCKGRELLDALALALLRWGGLRHRAAQCSRHFDGGLVAQAHHLAFCFLHGFLIHRQPTQKGLADNVAAGLPRRSHRCSPGH